MQETEEVKIEPIKNLLDTLHHSVSIARDLALRGCTLDEYIAALKTSITSQVGSINV